MHYGCSLCQAPIDDVFALGVADTQQSMHLFLCRPLGVHAYTVVSPALAMSFKCVCVCIRVSVHIPSINLVSRRRQVYSDQYPACVYTVVTLSSLAYFHHHRHYPTCTLIFTILPNSHLHNTTFTLIFTILPPPSSSLSYLHPHLHNTT